MCSGNEHLAFLTHKITYSSNNKTQSSGCVVWRAIRENFWCAKLCVCYVHLGTNGYRTLFGHSRTDMQFLYGRKISLLKFFLKNMWGGLRLCITKCRVKMAGIAIAFGEMAIQTFWKVNVVAIGKYFIYFLKSLRVLEMSATVYLSTRHNLPEDMKLQIFRHLRIIWENSPCIYIYIYTHIYVYIYIYIHFIYIQGNRPHKANSATHSRYYSKKITRQCKNA